VHAQGGHEFADQDLGAATDKRRLAFENEDPLHHYVMSRSPARGPEWTLGLSTDKRKSIE
jgi:hypothetical protein